MLVQMQYGSPCQLQVRDNCMQQKRDLGELFSSLEGGVRKVKTC